MSILLRRISDLEKENANLNYILELCDEIIEKVDAENTRLREALQMIATEKDNHGQWLSVEQAAQIAKDTLDGGLI
ncbi:MAG: hypothetical protein KH349_06830 [Clostridium sp.]|nr:hypothetical protein [Clostridium sp.]